MNVHEHISTLTTTHGSLFEWSIITPLRD